MSVCHRRKRSDASGDVVALGGVVCWCQPLGIDIRSNERRDDGVVELEATALKDRHGNRCPGAPVLARDEEPVLSAEGDRAMLSFSGVVVERQADEGECSRAIGEQGTTVAVPSRNREQRIIPAIGIGDDLPTVSAQ